MWKLEYIEIENIVSFREARMDVNQNVATLIFGRNEDNPSQPCNGSGKSSLIEAISFALTGEQLRKVKSVEEIINDNCDNARVFAFFSNDYFQCTLGICRTISRKGPQVIECHKYDYDGNEIDTENTVQPTVADYNKYILSEIGLTKDDIYNNFILCDNKYESFFDASDKSKKEIINRFSNGELVDESIARVQADLEPVTDEMKKLEDLVYRQEGSVTATRDAISKADEQILADEAERKRHAEEYEQKITDCRDTIERCQQQIEKAKDRKKALEDVLGEIRGLASSDISLSEGYDKVSNAFHHLDVQGLKNWLVESMELKAELSEYQEQLESLSEQLNQARYAVETVKKELDGRNAALGNYDAQYKEWLANGEGARLTRDKAKVQEIKAYLDKLEKQLTAMEVEDDRLKGAIANARKMIEGAVKCPNCGFAFIVADDTSVEDYKKKVEKLEGDAEKNRKEYNRVADSYDQAQDSLEEFEKRIKKTTQEDASFREKAAMLELKVRESQSDLTKAERELVSIESGLSKTRNIIDSVTGKIELLRSRMFAQAEQLLEDRIVSGEGYIRQTEGMVAHTEGLLVSYRQYKNNILNEPASNLKKSLEETLKKRLEDWHETSAEFQKKQMEWARLKDQETSFILFKSYLARKKIDALSLIVNDFLEKIGSDIRLKLEGFSVTKTGKLRDKISVNVMRDGVDCGSFQKFSGGEKARLNLACILSLHTLTNSNCEDGRGLDFLIIDELLDKSDEVGIATYCEALNKLGQTALLITQGAVAEGYPHKLLITKSKGTSTISN